jgi:Uma2 family endonuclease
LLMGIFGGDRVRTQLPVAPGEEDASRSLPEPDVAVTREPEPAYRSRHPGAGDLLSIAEVADSTYDYDVKRKGRLYARSAFPEYLVLDLGERELLLLRNPREGIYTEIQVLRPGDVYCPVNAPESTIEWQSYWPGNFP